MLIDNILFLRKKYPAIRDYFRDNESEVQTDKVEVIESKKGDKTLQYYTEDNQKLMVHSKYDPIREAERIIASHEGEITNDTHVFFYGIGLGYHIEKFQEAFPNHNYSIYEPIPEIFFTISAQVELKQVMTNKMTNLYMDTHKSESNSYLEEFRTSNKKIHIIVLPSYQNIIKGKIQYFQDNVRKTVLNRRSNFHTNINFQKHWVLNSILNFKTVLDTPNMLKDIDRKQFEGKPAIIVSAGPSLVEDIEHLRFIKENNLAYLFSVGSAINSLIEYDVLPDAVCTYDPGEKNHLVFKKMIEKGIKDMPMIFGSSVGYETLTRYEGPKAHFITSQDRTSLYFLHDQIEFNDLILDSPSIAVMTFQLLNKLGASPIIFAGQNLGYLYDRKYSEGIEYEHIESKVESHEMDNALITNDVYGNQIKTNRGFNSMRENIEHYARMYTENTFINTTKGGSAIEGVPFRPIDEVIKSVLTEPIEKQKWLEEKNGYGQSVIDRQLENMVVSKNEFHEILGKLDIVLEFISTSTKLRNKAKLEMALTQFDELYNMMSKNIYYTTFLSFYSRVDVEFVANEIKRLNKESNIFIMGEAIVRVFNAFLEKCRVNGIEMNRIFNSEFIQKNSEFQKKK